LTIWANIIIGCELHMAALVTLLIGLLIEGPAIGGPGCAQVAQVQKDLEVLLAPKFDSRDLDKKEFAELRGRIIQNTSDYNIAILEHYLGSKFDVSKLSQSSLPDLLRFFHSHDPKGSLEVARALKTSMDNCLTVFDLVKDKQAFFKLVTNENAGTIAKYVRFRDKVNSLNADFTKTSKEKN